MVVAHEDIVKEAEIQLFNISILAIEKEQVPS